MLIQLQTSSFITAILETIRDFKTIRAKVDKISCLITPIEVYTLVKYIASLD